MAKSSLRPASRTRPWLFLALLLAVCAAAAITLLLPGPLQRHEPAPTGATAPRSLHTTPAPYPAESHAEKIAVGAFHAYTRGAITQYTITRGPHTAEEWRFFFQGVGPFARPGYHWWVSVRQGTEETHVEAGE